MKKKIVNWCLVIFAGAILIIGVGIYLMFREHRPENVAEGTMNALAFFIKEAYQKGNVICSNGDFLIHARKSGNRKFKQVPLDPWNHPLLIKCDKSKSEVIIRSYGPDGFTGGSGENDDVVIRAEFDKN